MVNLKQGDKVEVLKMIKGNRNSKKAAIYRGIVVQVCRKFAVVDFGFYKESFHFEQITKVENNVRKNRRDRARHDIHQTGRQKQI